MPQKFGRTILIILVVVSVLPFLYFFRDLDFSLLSSSPNDFWLSFSHIFGAVSGYIGSILFVWEMLLGIRYLITLFTPDLMFANKIHSIIGKYGLLLVLVHPILEMFSYLESWIWIFLPSIKNSLEIHLTFGRMAFVLFLIIYLTSALVRGQVKYRPWLYIHYLSYPLMGLTFLHALDIGSYLNSQPIIKAAWFTLFALYLVLIVFRLAFYSGFLKSKFKVVNLQKAAGDVLYLEVLPTTKKLGYKPGQFFYIQLSDFGESHPFSLMEYEPNSGRMLFALKIIGSFTKEMSNLQAGDIVNIDGPYGVFTENIGPNDNVIFLAGGIGITPFVQLALQRPLGKTLVFHSNFNLVSTVGYSALKQKLGNGYINFISNESVSAENVINSKLDGEILTSLLGPQYLTNYKYYICGSPGYVKGIQNMLETLKIPKQNVELEKFSN